MTAKEIIEELENLARLDLSEEVKTRAGALLKEFLAAEFTPEEFNAAQSLFVKAGLLNHQEFNTVLNGKKPAALIPAQALSPTTGVPIPNLANCCEILARHPDYKEKIWHDEFHRKIFTSWDSKQAREWKDVDTLALTQLFQNRLGMFRVTPDTVHNAVRLHASKNLRNEPRDWIGSLQWDGAHRVKSFFAQALGASDNPYTDTISQNFWVSMIARVFTPGCQMDSMVVLEGVQGLGKSSALRIIGGKWYTLVNEPVTTKDFFLSLCGKLVAEIAELDSFNRAEVTRIRQVISSPTDRYRVPYGKIDEDFPRMSIFAGTTNEHEYLRDNTGARRFWPVTCYKINLDLISKNRTQLFAEALSLYKDQIPWWLVPQNLALEVQEERRMTDPWEDIIRIYLIGKSETTLSNVASDAIKIDKNHQDMRTQKRIGAALRKLGWEKFVQRDENSTLQKIWKLKDSDL